MPHISTQRRSIFIESGLMDESPETTPTPSPSSPRKSASKLFSGFRISTRSSPKSEEGPLSPTMASPSSPLSQPSIQLRRPAFRHARTKSLSVLPEAATAPPLLRSVTSPSKLRFTPSFNSPTSPFSSKPFPSPLRVNTPSPPPALVFDSHPNSLTPVRSRSPSVSSLDTIEDAPDAEQAAELEPIPPKTPTNDYFSRPMSSSPIKGHRKRWSVCGFEKRSDLELETIWEERGFNPQGQMQVAKSGVGKVWIVDSDSTEAH